MKQKLSIPKTIQLPDTREGTWTQLFIQFNTYSAQSSRTQVQVYKLTTEKKGKAAKHVDVSKNIPSSSNTSQFNKRVLLISRNNSIPT